MALRRSYTAIIERNRVWHGEFASEPYEAAWASEAIFFVRALAVSGDVQGVARVQISADGMHWADEGATLELPATKDGVAFCKVTRFGGWLRIQGEVTGGSITALVSLALKE